MACDLCPELLAECERKDLEIAALKEEVRSLKSINTNCCQDEVAMHESRALALSSDDIGVEQSAQALLKKL